MKLPDTFGDFDSADEPSEPAESAQQPQEGEKPRFTIDTEEKANWYMRKVRNIDSEIETVAAQAEKRIAELQADRRRLTDRYDTELEAWAKVEAERRRRQTVTLQQGTIRFTNINPALKVVDQAAATQAAKASGYAYTETTQVVSKFDSAEYLKRAKAHFEKTGDLMPGIDRTEGRESVSVTFGAGKDAKGETIPHASPPEGFCRPWFLFVGKNYRSWR